MQIIGRVEVILNDQYLLISSDEELREGRVLTVYAIVEHEEIKKTFELESVGIHKGYISIIKKESENIYLAEVFQQTEEKRRVITHPSSFEKLTAGALRGMFEVSKEEVINLEPGEWSGKLDKSASLNLKFKAEITEGDVLGTS